MLQFTLLLRLSNYLYLVYLLRVCLFACVVVCMCYVECYVESLLYMGPRD